MKTCSSGKKAMNNRLYEALIKQFGVTNMIIESELRQIEATHNVVLRPTKNKPKDDQTYYPQFDESIRREAQEMSEHYEIFYCLEKSIRSLIREQMETSKGPDWWNTILEDVRVNAKKAMAKEVEAGVTVRSIDPLDFTTFGELGKIIDSNWDVFSDIFNDQKAVSSVISRLNTLRSPIAHCSQLAEDEILRLTLTVRDWFRLME